MEFLKRLVESIEPPDASLGRKAQDRLDNLTKPPGSLGRLEETARRLAVMRGTLELEDPRPAATVFAADHGIVKAGVSLYPSEVTPQMVLNFLAGGAGINVLSRLAGAEIRVVDVGVAYDFGQVEGLVHAKVAPGTANMLEGPAMTAEQCLKALEVGEGMAAALIGEGFDLLITGEMGIGNTTASAALTAVFTGRTPAEVTGRGTGLDDGAVARKAEIIGRILDLHKPDPADPFGVLAKVGGLEIAAITGYILGAASRRIPVLLDGFISTAAALTAVRMAPAAREYLFAGHQSAEAGHRIQLEALGLDPLLSLGLRLGEGTGAALAVSVVRGAVAIYNQMATFESAGVTH